MGNSQYSENAVTDDFADVMDQVMFEEFVDEEPEEKVFPNNLGFVAVEHDYDDHYDENDIQVEYQDSTEVDRPFGTCKNVTKVLFDYNENKQGNLKISICLRFLALSWYNPISSTSALVVSLPSSR